MDLFLSTKKYGCLSVRLGGLYPDPGDRRPGVAYLLIALDALGKLTP